MGEVTGHGAALEIQSKKVKTTESTSGSFIRISLTALHNFIAALNEGEFTAYHA